VNANTDGPGESRIVEPIWEEWHAGMDGIWILIMIGAGVLR
jgi:hypothetical protein